MLDAFTVVKARLRLKEWERVPLPPHTLRQAFLINRAKAFDLECVYHDLSHP